MGVKIQNVWCTISYNLYGPYNYEGDAASIALSVLQYQVLSSTYPALVGPFHVDRGRHFTIPTEAH